RVSAGETAHVTWTIANHGSEPFQGPWHDTLYLGAVAGAEHLRVGEVLVGRAVTLGPGQSRTVEADVRVPGGVVGDYLWTVEANSRGDVFEGANAANNRGSSTASASLDVPALVLDGAAVAGAFGAPEEPRWFRCSAPAGKDVSIRLDLGSAAGVSELYVGRGFVPTPTLYTSRHREFASTDTSLVVSGTGDPGATNVFYVLALGRVLTAVPETFEIRAVSAPFLIESVRQERVGNAGRVTLEILGSGFQPGTRFAVSSKGDERVAEVLSLRQEGRAFATFDLTGMPVGKATVSASREGIGVSLADRLTVIEGGAPEFYAEVAGPGTTRAGRSTTWQVTYGNRGVLDLRLPMLRFSAPGASEIRLYESTLNWADAFAFLALNPDVLLPTLGPGQEVTFEVRLKAATPVNVSLDVVTGEQWMKDGTPFDWASLPAPPGADGSAWAAMLGTLPNRLGATVADYASKLEAELAGIREDSFRYAYIGHVNGRWLFGEEPSSKPEILPIIDVPAAWAAEGDQPSLHAAPKKIPGDGIRKTWWVIITMEDYALSRARGVGAANTGNVAADQRNMQTYARVDLRTPASQITGAHDSTNEVGTWTRENILSEIRTFQGKVDADDNLVVVYSGHGGRTDNGTGWLVANGGGVSPTAFAKAIDDVGAGTTYFVNNSCHSEAFNEAVAAENTRFVGLAATQKDRIAWSDPVGSPMIRQLKGQLRKCRGLGLSFEMTTALVAHEFETEALEKHRQNPVLTNPTDASLEGKPWNDPAGFEQEFRRRLLNLPYQRWGEALLGIVGSVDPNDKYALAGAGPERWVRPDQLLPFEVVFENKTNAAAAAQEVLVVDQLDARYDWSTFELKTIAFNDARIVVPPGLQRYTTTTRVGTDRYDVVVDVKFRPDTGRIEWLMRSIDPATGDLPEDPFAGFLPPNDSTRRGEGSLTYVVRPRPGLPDGQTLTNRAVIVFDPTYGANPPIETPWVTNTVDGLPPASGMMSMPAVIDGETVVSWTGQDAAGGSGIASYDIYVARDDEAYRPWLIATTATSARFSGMSGSSYRFYSVARDAAGNTEAAPSEPDTRTQVSGGVGPVAIALEGMAVKVTFDGALQWADTPKGPWSDVPGATSPFVTHAMPGGSKFFRSRSVGAGVSPDSR
ncbi:MAG: caspase family protein, partial [Verrucomicrobiales bacterium]|nr:caspase family protein [Verrucomicrobiales bacterium]